MLISAHNLVMKNSRLVNRLVVPAAAILTGVSPALVQGGLHFRALSPNLANKRLVPLVCAGRDLVNASKMASELSVSSTTLLLTQPLLVVVVLIRQLW